MNYFDNAATTFPKPEIVYQFMDTFYRTYGVNVGRGQFKTAATASALISETRELLLELLECDFSREVIFTHSATEAMNVVLQGLNFSDSQVVYITPFEHNAVLRTLNYLKTVFNLKIIPLAVNKKTLSYDIEKIKYTFHNDKPDFVIMTHASNVLGNITPIKEICKLAKIHNAITIVDIAQTAGLLDIRLHDIMVDYAIFAGHKTLYAPFGIAGFIANKGNNLSPLIYGGTGIDSFNLSMPQSTPERLEAGSQNIMAISGLNASLKWIKEIGLKNIRNKEVETTNKLLTLLKSYYNITVIRSNNEEENIGIVSCVFDGYSCDSIGKILDEQNIAVRTGLHCAPKAHEFIGTLPDGTVRFSISYFTENTDLENLKIALDYIENNG